jgi:large subunit ribosomal protein L18
LPAQVRQNEDLQFAVFNLRFGFWSIANRQSQIANENMADKNKLKTQRLQRRKRHIRNSLMGSSERPRLSVFRSDKHIYAQLIDDYTGKTLAAVSSTLADVRGELKNGGNVKAAKLVGKAIAERAKAAGIYKVAFDRGGRTYHGRVKALADAAREGGLKF